MSNFVILKSDKCVTALAVSQVRAIIPVNQYVCDLTSLSGVSIRVVGSVEEVVEKIESGVALEFIPDNET